MAGCFFSATSLSGVVAVSVDRFLAVHFHLRYQELVTHKRVVIVVISTELDVKRSAAKWRSVVIFSAPP